MRLNRGDRLLLLLLFDLAVPAVVIGGTIIVAVLVLNIAGR